jgi:hypothetical protein
LRLGANIIAKLDKFDLLILARFRNGPERKQATVQHVKRTLEAFLENGPAARETPRSLFHPPYLLQVAARASSPSPKTSIFPR